MKELKVGEYFNYCWNCAFGCPSGWCANDTLKCKNHQWNVLNNRLYWDWTLRERSDNKCVIFKEVKE